MQKVNRGSVREVFKRAERLSINYEAIKDKSDTEAYRIFFPEHYQSEIIYTLPIFSHTYDFFIC